MRRFPEHIHRDGSGSITAHSQRYERHPVSQGVCVRLWSVIFEYSLWEGRQARGLLGNTGELGRPVEATAASGAGGFNLVMFGREAFASSAPLVRNHLHPHPPPKSRSDILTSLPCRSPF